MKGNEDEEQTGAPRSRRGRSRGLPPEASRPSARDAPRDAPRETAPPETRKRYENLPVVVIAGRPNVGKSTLYNRLLHKRKAITDPTPGVTRDAIDAVCDLGGSGRRVRLMDTGGFKLDRAGLDSLVVEKSMAAIERADLVLFLVDAVSVTPEDEEFAAFLRRRSGKVLLVVNKADSPERDNLVWEHVRWGYGPVLRVSAEHGRNLDELEEAIAARLDFSAVIEVPEERSPIRLAIMGKPNTGKSTLLNRLLGEPRSIVSELAGTTRDIVEGSLEWKRRRIVVLDTAGIRRKAKVTERVEYYSVNRAIRVVEDCDVVVLLIDAVEGLTDQDKKISAFASKEGRGLVFALNKWDMMPDLKNSFEAASDKLRYFFGQMAYAPVLPLSARSGLGVDKLLNTVVTLHAQLGKRIETSKLNKAVESWIETTPPPSGPRTRFKVRYAVQTSVNPQRFSVFVSRPEAVPDSYLSFLRNKIREELGLDRIPVEVELKASHSGPAAERRTRQSGEAGAAASEAKRPAAGAPAGKAGRGQGSSARSDKPRAPRPAASAPRAAMKAPTKKGPRSTGKGNRSQKSARDGARGPGAGRGGPSRSARPRRGG